MDKITLRLEAARIAAQLAGVSTKNFIPVARRVERYIEGNRISLSEEEQEDFNQAARHRHELYHDMGIAPQPFDERDIAYLAPGGIPSTEAESIFLQADGEKVE